MRKIATKMSDTENQLKKNLGIEQQLRDEINTLQTKLDHTFADPVTNLLGWQLFEDRLNHHMMESIRYQLPLGILFIDIDDFKMINNALGYEIGDELLRQLSKRIKSITRQVDSMSRFSKDTFVILLTQLVKPETTALVAQRILQALREPFQVKSHELYITVCIGIAIYPADGQNSIELLQSADHALHLAKEKGHHIYQFYQEKMHAKSMRELVLYNSMSRESIFEEFVLFYQPIVDTNLDTIVGMQVLLRWHHPELGLINSDEVFNYVEKQHKSNLISEWLLRKACTQFLHWRSLNFNPSFISIPFLFKQFENSHFIYRLSQILQELNYKPECLVLEIKERFSGFSFDILDKAFNMLKYIGVKIAIDSFGTGLFPLYHLKNFKVNYLQLEQSLIEDIEQNEQSLALVKSILTLAKNMSMEVIIKDIESEQQKKILKDLGCHLMQGSLLGKPLSEQELIDKMTVSSLSSHSKLD